MNNNKIRSRSSDPYWNKFLESGKVEDYIKYKIAQKKLQEADVEFAKMDEANGELNEQRNKVLRNRHQSD